MMNLVDGKTEEMINSYIAEWLKMIDRSKHRIDELDLFYEELQNYKKYLQQGDNNANNENN